MKHLFNPQPLPIRLTKCELTELWQYLCKCDREAFVGVNNYNRFMKDREYMYHWHLKEIANRVLLQLLKHSQALNSKKLSFRVTEIEQKTLSILFNRVDCTPYMLQLQTRFINHLTKQP